MQYSTKIIAQFFENDDLILCKELSGNQWGIYNENSTRPKIDEKILIGFPIPRKLELRKPERFEQGLLLLDFAT